MVEPFPILGLDIGGTKTAIVLGDSSGAIVERVQFPTAPRRGFAATFAEICARGDALLDQAMAQNRAPVCVSVSIGGPLDIARGLILSPPHLPGWDNIPLRNLLEARWLRPVYVEHDGNAGALAEWYFGAARGARNVIFLTLGTGLGAGLILDSRLYRGTCDLAGEVGHMRMAEDGPIAYGKTGSWEAFCSGAGLGALAGRLFPQRWGGSEIAPAELAALAGQGDAQAATVLTESGRHLGRGLALLVDILNPEVIVLGALATRLGVGWLDCAREELSREALPAAAAACRVVPTELGDRLGDVAALCAAIAARAAVAGFPLARE